MYISETVVVVGGESYLTAGVGMGRMQSMLDFCQVPLWAAQLARPGRYMSRITASKRGGEGGRNGIGIEMG